MNREAVSTLAGGGAGMAMLASVRWEAVPHGECVKVGVAIVLIAFGYLMYRGGGTDKMA